MIKQEKQWNEEALIPNPFSDKLCCDVSLNLPKSVVAYFAEIGQQTGWPAERIIEIYLRNIEFTGYKIPLDLPDRHT